eukprot:scaffold174425_cov19-Tisochrysis_lutea.AAC.1
MGSFFVPLVRIACFIEASPLARLSTKINSPTACLNPSNLLTTVSSVFSSLTKATGDGAAHKASADPDPHPCQQQEAAQGTEQQPNEKHHH